MSMQIHINSIEHTWNSWQSSQPKENQDINAFELNYQDWADIGDKKATTKKKNKFKLHQVTDTLYIGLSHITCQFFSTPESPESSETEHWALSAELPESPNVA